MIDPATAAALGGAARGAVDLASGLKNIFSNGDGPGPTEQMNLQWDMWKRINRNQMQYRVKDAEAAGLHPLAALGMSPAGGPSFSVFPQEKGPSTMEAIGQMGQGISRAATAFQDREAREIELMSAGLSIENQQLQNERLRSEIALMRTSQVPSFSAAQPLIPGSGDVLKVPKEYHAALGGVEKGQRAALQEMVLPQLGPVRFKSEDMANATEDSIIASLMLDLFYTVPDIGVAIAKKLPGALKDIMLSPGNYMKRKYR